MGEKRKDKKDILNATKPIPEYSQKPPVSPYKVNPKESPIDRMIREGLDEGKIPVGYDNVTGRPRYRGDLEREQRESIIRDLGDRMKELPFEKWDSKMMQDLQKYYNVEDVARILAAKQKARGK